MRGLPYLVLLAAATLATFELRPSGWLDRLVQYHKEQFLQDVNELAPFKIKATVEPRPPGYEDSEAWDYDSVMRLLGLIAESEEAVPARMAIRRALQSSRRFMMSREESFKKFPSMQKYYQNNFYYDVDEPEFDPNATTSSTEKTPFDENAIVRVSNPVEARLPSAQISIKLLKRIMESRAKAARIMPETNQTTTTTIAEETHVRRLRINN